MTRQRELILISDIVDYKIAFPHILNFLPIYFDRVARQINQQTRNSRYRVFVGAANRIWQAVIRSFVILVFVLPMIFSYTYSFIQLLEVGGGRTSLLWFYCGILEVFIFGQSFGLIFQEWAVLNRKEFYE